MAEAESDEVVAATFKILVLGDSNVGKSSLIKSCSTNQRPKNLMPTVGVDFTDVVVSVRGTKIKLRVWDTAGQEKFYTFTKQFFRGAQGVLLVYDITNMDSFRRLQKWNGTLMEAGLTDIGIMVVGNKADLEDLRVVPKEMLEQFAIHNHRTQSIETSVHSGTNVKRAFYLLAEHLIFSHGIFQPGREATTTEDSFGALYHTGVGLTPRTSDSFSLNDSSKTKEYSDRKKCCHHN